MMPDNWNAIAQAAYEAYAQTVRSEHEPLPVPEWENLPPREQEGWREAVQRASQMIPPYAPAEE